MKFLNIVRELIVMVLDFSNENNNDIWKKQNKIKTVCLYMAFYARNNEKQSSDNKYFVAIV